MHAGLRGQRRELAMAPGNGHSQPEPRTDLSREGTDLSQPQAGQHDSLLRLIMPTCCTPGFDLASPRIFQVWLALLAHARWRGRWTKPEDKLPEGVRCAIRTWIQEGAAR